MAAGAANLVDMVDVHQRGLHSPYTRRGFTCPDLHVCKSRWTGSREIVGGRVHLSTNVHQRSRHVGGRCSVRGLGPSLDWQTASESPWKRGIARGRSRSCSQQREKPPHFTGGSRESKAK